MGRCPTRELGGPQRATEGLISGVCIGWQKTPIFQTNPTSRVLSIEVQPRAWTGRARCLSTSVREAIAPQWLSATTVVVFLLDTCPISSGLSSPPREMAPVLAFLSPAVSWKNIMAASKSAVSRGREARSRCFCRFRCPLLRRSFPRNSQPARTVTSSSSGFEDVKSFDQREMPLVECGCVAATLQSGCGHDQVVRSRFLTACSSLRIGIHSD